MAPPPFVKDVKGIWTLAGDGWIRPHIESCGRLNWELCFKECVHRLGDRPGKVVDVGAFIGDSAAWFPGRELITFEPQRDAFLCLQHNIPSGWHIPFPAGNGELVSLVFAEGGNMGGRGTTNGGNIRTIKIDDLGLMDVAFLKIDVEGWEPNVLAGAVQTIERCRPFVMIEFNKGGLGPCGFTYGDILKYFKGWNWIEVYRYGSDQWDVLYLP